MSHKSLHERTNELKDALLLIDDALQNVRRGERHYFKVISAQLRALICYGGRNFQPLLLDLAKEKNIPLLCYGPRGADPNDPLSRGMTLMIYTRFIGLDQYSPVQQRYELMNWLGTYFFVFGPDWYTPNEILRVMAEKEGGVHYDHDLPEKYQKLRGIVYSGKFQYGEKLLVETAIVIQNLGKEVIEKLCSSN